MHLVIRQDRSVNIRQAFIPFVGQLNPNAPTEQQRKAVEQASGIAKTAKSCADIEEANKRVGNVRPSNPGEVQLEAVGSGPLRALLAGLQPNQPSRPVVSNEGVAVLMLCSREQRTAAEPSKQDITNQLLSQRIELGSRQLQRDLRRRAVLDLRS